MKIRLSDDEIRIRLAHEDVAVLLDGGVVDCVVMPGTYVVRLTTSAHVRSEITFATNGIDVTIPPSALPDTLEDFESHSWGGDARHPNVVIELDRQRRPRKRIS
ncbi:MAG: hypothetical protein ACC683_07770 [Acidimicrobiia bacterium]